MAENEKIDIHIDDNYAFRFSACRVNDKEVVEWLCL